MLIDALETLFPDHNFHWSKRDVNAKGLCPLHKNDHTPAFAVYVDAKGHEKWHCFTEDIGGNLLDIVRLSGIPGTESLPGANNWLIKNGFLQETEQQKKSRERNEALYRFYQWTNELLCKSPDAAGIRAYIASRNIDTDTLPLSALGYYPSLRTVREWIVKEGLSDILESEVCVSEARNVQVAGSIIFFYKSAYNEISRLKVRNVAIETDKEKKTSFLGTTTGRQEIGFFSWFMNCSLPDKAILVEGEFDVGALNSLIYREDPSRREPIYCFSGGGNISKGVQMITNMGIENIYIFPDNDEAGTKYAQNIASTFPDTYNIVPSDYHQEADPAEWAAKHKYADLQKAFENRCPAFMWIGQKLAVQYCSDATIEEQAAIRAEIIDYGRKLSPTNRESFIKAFGSLAGTSIESVMQEIEEASAETFRKSTKNDKTFGIWMLVPKGKNPEWKHISNIIMEHVQDTVLDDGSGAENLRRCVTVRLTTINQSKVVDIDVDTFIDDKKLRKALVTVLGAASVIIEPKQESNLRNSMAALSMASQGGDLVESSLVYTHTGWRDGKFYMPTGYIDEEGFHELEDIKVKLPDNPPYFEHYFLTDAPSDMEPAKKFVREELLRVFPYKITLPYLAHIFWSVINCLVPIAKPYCLWVVGQTGSFKTSYTGVMTSFFGDFRTADFETWRSTPNSLEMNGYYLKDVPFVIDDYKPIDCKRQEVTRLIQNYADRHGRSRMYFSKSPEYDRLWWIRGNMIVTAEDVPPEGETSITARTLELRIPKGGSSVHLTNAQLGATMLPGVMTKFIQFMCTKHLNQIELEKLLAERRNKYPAIHARVRESLAANSLAWDFVSEFFGFEDLQKHYDAGIDLILQNMNQATQDQQASSVIIESLRSLLYSGKHHLEGLNGYPDTPHGENSVRLGWIDENGVYLVGAECLAEVNRLRIQLTGSGVNYTQRTIYDQLYSAGALIQENGKNTSTRRIGGFLVRIIKLKRGVIEEESRETPNDKIESQTSVVRDPRVDDTE